MRVTLEAILNIIRENLNDRYENGFPIIKELIQNADDAGATHFDFGISDGLPDAQHPLLRGPALFVINNGTFSSAHSGEIDLLFRRIPISCSGHFDQRVDKGERDNAG